MRMNDWDIDVIDSNVKKDVELLSGYIQKCADEFNADLGMIPWGKYV